MALYAQIPKNRVEIKRSIVAIEWQLKQDIPDIL